MAACGAVGRGFESLWARFNIELSPKPLRLVQSVFNYQLTRKPVDRSILSGESIILFKAAIRNAITRDPYERRLIAFLNTIGMDPDSFVDLARKKPRVAKKGYFIHNRTSAKSR
jgi:hypothetical protein